MRRGGGEERDGARMRAGGRMCVCGLAKPCAPLVGWCRRGTTLCVTSAPRSGKGGGGMALNVRRGTSVRWHEPASGDEGTVATLGHPHGTEWSVAWLTGELGVSGTFLKIMQSPIN
jgi:hypothetical protein